MVFKGTSKIGTQSSGNLEVMVSYNFNLSVEKENKTYKDYKNIEWISKLAIRAAQIVGMEKRQFR